MPDSHRPPTGPVAGSYGRAEPVLFDPARPEAAETLCVWLIEAPGWSPVWAKYLLTAVRLRDDVPGFGPPKRQFLGATHEILLMALDPDYPATAEALAQPGYQVHWLEPINLVYQVQATDAEVRDVVALMAWGIVCAGLAPEPSLGFYEAFREDWAASITKTLAHRRGEVHAP